MCKNGSSGLALVTVQNYTSVLDFLLYSESRSPQKSAMFDVRFINLGAAVDVKLVREAVKEPASLPNLNMGKVMTSM